MIYDATLPCSVTLYFDATRAHAHQLLLKLAAPVNKIILFCKFRLRCYELAYTSHRLALKHKPFLVFSQGGIGDFCPGVKFSFSGQTNSSFQLILLQPLVPFFPHEGTEHSK